MGNITYFKMRTKVKPEFKKAIEKLKNVEDVYELSNEYISSVLNIIEVPSRLTSIISMIKLEDENILSIDMMENGIKNYDDDIETMAKLIYANMIESEKDKPYGDYRYESNMALSKIYKGEVVSARTVAPYKFVKDISLDDDTISFIESMLDGHTPWLDIPNDTPKILLEAGEDGMYSDLAKECISIDENVIHLNIGYFDYESKDIDEFTDFLDARKI
ncbi:MAG: hypothetical protein ACRCXX_09570 [Cetobacterium sp.]|uniref:hypothetical protein n=1 Tax=Cetobacterium sp. TaxID=2071632 RepID=UPI003F33CB23